MKIASLLFIPALLLSGLTARAGLPASFKRRSRLAEASRETRTIQCDFTQRKQGAPHEATVIELKGRFDHDNSLAMALDYTVPEGDKVIIRNDRIILKTAGQVTQTATSANPMLQQVALMIRASMTGDLSQFGQGWQIGYTEKEGVGEVKMVPEVEARPQVHRLDHALLRPEGHDLRPHGTLRDRGRAFGLRIPQQAFQPPGRPRKVQPLTLRPHPMQDLFTSIDNYLAQEGHYAFRVRLDASRPGSTGGISPGHPVLPGCPHAATRTGMPEPRHGAQVPLCGHPRMPSSSAWSCRRRTNCWRSTSGWGTTPREGTRLSCTITNHGKTVLKLGEGHRMRNAMTIERNDILAVIPTYNNEKTLARVIGDVRRYCTDVLVVNDGSTDSTAGIIAGAGVGSISYAPNRGKGYALRRALRYAAEHGYRYMLTIDSDGQHYASDIPKFVEEIAKTPDALLVGARNLRSDNMPGKNTFANKFSNFWFRVETGIRLDDTQSGFRLYPVRRMKGMRFATRRYEFEVEVLVRAA